MKSFQKGLLIAACVILLLAVIAGVYLMYYKHKKTVVLSEFTTQRPDGTYYATASNSKSSVLVESDVDLTPYLKDSSTVLTVSGEVTKLRIAHFDCMGLSMPCLSYDFRIHSVISAEQAAEE